MAQIIGLQSKDQLGILKAFALKFDPKTNRVVKFKGSSGEGKTTAMDALKMCIHGPRILQDKKLRNIGNLETQILDGEHKLFIGFKPDGNGSFESYLYEKNAKGKKIKEPTIEGVKCTPSAWQKLMTNELTWNYAGFTSPNPSEHKNTLLKLFQTHLKDIGVVFDVKSSTYKGTILHQIDEAINARSYADMKRKESGGVADDLKDNYGVDVKRPVTFPERVDLSKYDARISEINKALGNLEADKKNRLQAILLKASDLEKEAMMFNDEVEIHNKTVSDWDAKTELIAKTLKNLRSYCEGFCEFKHESIKFAKRPESSHPIVITNGKIVSYSGDNEKGLYILKRRADLISSYQKIDNEPISDDEYNNELSEIATKKDEGLATNKICGAIDLFKEWSLKNGEVKRLQEEYVKLLTSIDIGVDGMKIFPEDDKIFLKYNGCHDPKYFHNEDGEYRKLNEYSGSQLPMIVLLLQAKMLEKRNRVLRYIFIDDIPIDKKTQKYIEEICEKLNLWVFVNINGDFEAKQLEDGEVLFENGEMFAANADMIKEVEAVEVDSTEEPEVKEKEKGSGFLLF